MTLISEEYSLIIDTNANAMDFAHMLCPYVIGITSEDTESEEQVYADMFYEDLGIKESNTRVALESNIFFTSVVDREDENHHLSPYAIWPSKEYGQNEAGHYAKVTPENYDEFDLPAPYSVGIFFDSEPTEKQISIIKERAAKFFTKIWPEYNMVAYNVKGTDVKIEGFRLITYKKYGEEKQL